MFSLARVYCSGSFETSYDYHGSDLDGGLSNINTITQCALLCGATPTCKSFSWGKNPSIWSYRMCFMKSAVMSGRISSDCCDSGLPCQANILAPTLLSLASASPGVEATVLYPGQRLCSPTNCSYYMTLQTDGKLALYNQSNTSLWTSNAGTCDAKPCTLAVQSNGSIAVYNRNNATFWSGSPFSSVGTGPFTLKVTDSGWPFVYDSSGNASGDPPHP